MPSDDQKTTQERARQLMRRNAGSPVEALIILAFAQERERIQRIILPYCNSSSLAVRILNAIDGITE